MEILDRIWCIKKLVISSKQGVLLCFTVTTVCFASIGPMAPADLQGPVPRGEAAYFVIMSSR